MAVGLFGGSFNPIHFGHLITSQRVMEIRKLDKIILMPCNISPFKIEASDLLEGHTRIRMLELAVGNNPNYKIDNFELKRGGVSFTYNTIIHLKQMYSNIELIIGFDQLVEFDRWYKAEEIVKEARLVVLKREIDTPGNRNMFEEKAEFVDTPTIDISGTEIRNRIRAGLSIEYLVPKTVADYIKQEKLYL
jgi:nicotinate-nucleotide adenylyltransferase